MRVPDVQVDRDVRSQNGIEINWRFFSLEEVNRVEGKKHPWEREWSYGWSMLRIGALLRRTSMDDLDVVRASGSGIARGWPSPTPARRRPAPTSGDRPGSGPRRSGHRRRNHPRRCPHRAPESDRLRRLRVPTMYMQRADGSEHCLFGPVLIDRPPATPPFGCGTPSRRGSSSRSSTSCNSQTKARRDRDRPDLSAYLNARDWVSINRGVEVGFGEDGFKVVGSADRDRS